MSFNLDDEWLAGVMNSLPPPIHCSSSSNNNNNSHEKQKKNNLVFSVIIIKKKPKNIQFSLEIIVLKKITKKNCFFLQMAEKKTPLMPNLRAVNLGNNWTA